MLLDPNTLHTVVSIGYTVMRDELTEEMAIEDVIRHCFAAAHQERCLWLLPHNEDTCFRVGLGFALAHYGTGTPEFDRINRNLEAFRILGAMQSGVPVDFEELERRQEDAPSFQEDFIPIRRIFEEERKKAHGA